REMTAGRAHAPRALFGLFGGDRLRLRRDPGRVVHGPDRIVDRQIHVAGENRESVVAVIRAGIVPGVHLAERDAHLLHRVLFLDPRADQIRAHPLYELLQLEAGHVVIDQRALLHVVPGALIVVAVAEFVARADDLHAEILVGRDDVAG